MTNKYFEYHERSGGFHDNNGSFPENTYGWRTLERDSEDDLEHYFAPLIYVINTRTDKLSFDQVRDLWTVYKRACKDETVKDGIVQLVDDYYRDEGYSKNQFKSAYLELLGIKNIFFKSYKE